MTASRAALVAAIGLCVSTVAAAQRPTRCSFQSDRFSTDSLPGIGQVTYLAGSVVIRCPARGIVLRGDSAEQRADGDHVIGHAVYDEPRFHVTSDFLNYFETDERIVAVGNVHARLPNGSTLVGPVAEYRRPVARKRSVDTVFARARPTITIIQKDSTGKPMDPMTVVAENVFMAADSLVNGWGQVVITRTDISATADSVALDEGKETVRLMKKPELRGKKDRPFSLKGELIDLYSKNRKLERVIARSKAVAVSDSMTLTSDTIDLRVRNDLLDHAYAWGATSRARAVSPSETLLADSLDITMPAQRIQLMRALTNAVAHSRVDTLRFHLEPPDTTDWLRGDTITAHFDTAATKDTSRTPNIRQLLANGHAAAWYHIPASDSSERRPAINQVTARLITISFEKQKVATVTAIDSVVGVYVEPRADSTARGDSTRKGAPPKGAPPKGAPANGAPRNGTPPKTPAKPPAKPPASPPAKPAAASPIAPKKP